MAPSRTGSTTTSSRTRRLSLVVSGLGVAFVGIQLIRPELPRAVVTNDLGAPPDVERILRSSCYDCHSDETRLLWFDRIVPAYWLVAEDVEKGRAHLNFSELGNATPARKRALLYESLNHVELGAMPPRRYTLLHPDAVVTPADRETLKKYLHAEGAAPPPSVTPITESSRTEDVEVRAAPNGLAFIRGYERWRAVTTSERFDSGTLRFIFANDVAVRAIETNRISPWPDGATFAKVLWTASPDAAGILRPGTFLQVDFMVKDAKRSASTLGWTWGRWLGAALVPYGNTAAFAQECAGCHAPMRGHDFVFTMPIQEGVGREDLFNRDTVLPSDLPDGLLARRVITMSIDPAHGTTSTVYGNDLAVAHARDGSADAYPPGSEIARVTWRERANPYWYGARIPGRVASVELVSTSPSNGVIDKRYTAYEGSSLHRRELPAADLESRRGDLLRETAALVPRGRPQVPGNR